MHLNCVSNNYCDSVICSSGWLWPTALRDCVRSIKLVVCNFCRKTPDVCFQFLLCYGIPWWVFWQKSFRFPYLWSNHVFDQNFVSSSNSIKSTVQFDVAQKRRRKWRYSICHYITSYYWSVVITSQSRNVPDILPSHTVTWISPSVSIRH